MARTFTPPTVLRLFVVLCLPGLRSNPPARAGTHHDLPERLEDPVHRLQRHLDGPPSFRRVSDVVPVSFSVLTRLALNIRYFLQSGCF